ncbi:MAG TPA: SPFH domain-containing protein [Magnetospirillaceae bacterium]|nr:SPFH domain-containing protein [Magnetospirillaceae bacterium]
MIDIALLGSLITPVLSVLGLGGAASSVRWVQEGDRALVQRFGKATRSRFGEHKGEYRVLEPGFNLIIPVIDKLAKTHVRQTVINMGDEEITLKDKTVFTVDGILVMSVGDTPDDLYKALFVVDDLYKAVRQYCIGVMREVIRELSYEELIGGNAHELSDKLAERIREQLADWGLIVHSFRLGDLSPYGETLRMIQTGEAARLKLKALQDVAEGLKELNINPMLAAAIIGVPVSVAVNENH